MEGLKSTVSSDYVVPAVRAITDDKEKYYRICNRIF